MSTTAHHDSGDSCSLLAAGCYEHHRALRFGTVLQKGNMVDNCSTKKKRTVLKAHTIIMFDIQVDVYT